MQMVLKAERVWTTIETTRPDIRDAKLEKIETYNEKSAIAAALILSS